MEKKTSKLKVYDNLVTSVNNLFIVSGFRRVRGYYFLLLLHNVMDIP